MSQLNIKDLPHDEWLKLRKTGLGGSEIGIILGVNKWKTPYELWEEKTGKKEGVEETPFMKRGRMLEPVVAEFFKEETGKQVWDDHKFRRHKIHQWAIANIDRLIVGEPNGTGVLEIKTASNFAMKNWDAGIPEQYFTQLIHYLMVGEWEWGEVAVLNVDKWILERFPFERDKRLEDIILNEGGEFWEKYVVKDTPPPKGVPDLALAIVKKSSRISASMTHVGQIEMIKNYDREIKEIERKKDALEDELKLYIGENETLYFDNKDLITWKQQTSKRVDIDKLKRDAPDIAGMYVKEIINRRFIIK